MSSVYLVVIYKGNAVDTIDETVYNNIKLAEERAYYLNSVMDNPHYEAFVEEKTIDKVLGKTIQELKG